MYQAIRTTYKGATDTKGSRFIARASAGSVSVPYDYALNADKNHIAAACALALKLKWVKTPAEFRNVYVGGAFDNDYYFVDRKGGSLRHIHRIEFEVQGNYGDRWEAATASRTGSNESESLTNLTPPGEPEKRSAPRHKF